MTIEAKTTFTPPKRKTVLVSKLDDGREIKARQNTNEVRIEPLGQYPEYAYIKYQDIDAVIELLFAVKADRDAHAAFEKKWLADNAASSAPKRLIEDDPLDIIAVTEPTA